MKSPAFDQHAGLQQHVEQFHIQQLIAKFSMKRLDVTVFTEAAWLDEQCPEPDTSQPVADSLRKNMGSSFCLSYFPFSVVCVPFLY